MDDGFGWVVDAIERCLPHAERRGVLLLLENHWGLTTFAHDMARIIETIDSPWLQAILDMGNFLFEDDMYAAMERIAPTFASAHAKTYPGGGSWYTLDLDYARIFASSSTPAGAATAPSRWKGPKTPPPPFPRALRCCAKPGATRADLLWLVDGKSIGLMNIDRSSRGELLFYPRRDTKNIFLLGIIYQSNILIQ